MAKAPKAEGGTSRIPLMVRTSPAFRAQLEEAAAASGRSLAQEAELRLERSFELVSMIETMAKTNADVAIKVIEDQCNRIERQMVELAGGDDLFMAWAMLSMVVRSVEAETGKSIREDEFTRHKAEREVLGYIPGIFRRLPDSYSSSKKKADKHSKDGPPTSGLAALGGLAPLGWTGPWPPEKD